jgi:hypothetical protein
MTFTEAFANGFVLEERTHFGQALGSIFTSSAVADRRYSGRNEGASPYKHVFLRNEPTDFVSANSIYPTGPQWVTQEFSAEKRWVRFPKRTHREGVFEGQTKEIGWFWGRIWGSERSHVDRHHATDS